jgi:hypothetical protein
MKKEKPAIVASAACRVPNTPKSNAGNAIGTPFSKLGTSLTNGQGVNWKFFHFPVKRQLEAIDNQFLQQAFPLLAIRPTFAFRLYFYVEFKRSYQRITYPADLFSSDVRS